MAKANYGTVRYHLAKRFDLSIMATGRRSGQRWSEGASISAQHAGVVVDYRESSAALRSDGSLRTTKLAEVRAHLETRFTVTDYGVGDGRMLVSDKV
jgi:hypothetical protein